MFRLISPETYTSAALTPLRSRQAVIHLDKYYASLRSDDTPTASGDGLKPVDVDGLLGASVGFVVAIGFLCGATMPL